MILSDDEINLLVREVSRGSAISRDGTTSQRIARAIEAKVLEKLSDKLRDAERYEYLRNNCADEDTNFGKPFVYIDFCEDGIDIDQAIDAAIKESK